MSTVRLSIRARSDLHKIGHFTQDKWGEKQADKYLSDLELALERLARYPLLGRPAGGRDPLRYRMEHGSHVVFYKQVEDGIFVLRLLHKSMMPEQHGI